jgi:hypothetical protein
MLLWLKGFFFLFWHSALSHPSEVLDRKHGENTEWVMERGILGQYQRARDFLYPHGFFPSQQLSWDTIWVQQNTATFVDNRWTSRRRNVFIPLRVFLSYM